MNGESGLQAFNLEVLTCPGKLRGISMAPLMHEVPVKYQKGAAVCIQLHNLTEIGIFIKYFSASIYFFGLNQPHYLNYQKKC